MADLRECLRNTMIIHEVAAVARCRLHSVLVVGPSKNSTNGALPAKQREWNRPIMDNIRVARVDDLVLERLVPPESPSGVPVRQRLTGTLHLTPHHLFFSPSSQDPSSSSLTPAKIEEIWIPYPSITLLTRLPQNIHGLYPLQIRTRTFDSFLLLFNKPLEGGAEDVWQSVKDCAVASSVEQLYAFFYTLPPVPASGSSSSNVQAVTSTPAIDAESPLSPITRTASLAPSPIDVARSTSGWSTFNPRTEFARQGVGSRTKAWRYTDVNKDFSFSPTYPAKLLVPSRISDSTLLYAGKYRSKGRIPVLTYLHWANQASITRSSQPMVGLKNARSSQDERLVECIFSSHLSADSAYTQLSESTSSLQNDTTSSVYGATATNLIIDARPTTNAMANVAMGAGTENMDNYRTGKKAYLGIDNIHVMRNSLKTIAEAVHESELNATPLDRGLLRKSNWLRHISTLLDGSLVIVKNVHLNASHVLIHCSDGWDRTSQLSAVAQLCLDPYYRTLEGFKVLIEKDWLAFGHKFLDRSGHLSSEKLFTVTDGPDDESDEEEERFGGGAQRAAQAFFASVQKQFSSKSHLKEISPVFHQFLECVYQIMRQYPTRFEFNEDYLLDIHYHLYSCQFGTFLFNCERERRTSHSGKPYVDRTVSAWDWFDRPEQLHKYRNETYDTTLDDRSSRDHDADQGVLLFDPRDVRFWFRLFRRGDEEMNGSKLSFQAQPTGADMVGPLGQGQVDPISFEGAVAGLTVPSPEDPLTSRGPSPTPASSNLPTSAFITSRSEVRQEPLRSHASSPSTLSTQSQAVKPRDSRLSTTGPAGWGWSQFSTGAISAISRAAGEIKNISQDAYSQLRAEASADGEMWSRGGAGASEPSGAVFSATGGGLPPSGSRGLRIPSEVNPWSSGPSSTPYVPRQSSHGTARRDVSGGNPWDDAASKPSLDKLSLHEAPNGLGGGRTANASESPAVAASPMEEDKALIEAALGGDKKAWDPLGAL